MMRRGGVGIGELTDPYLRAKVVMLCWLSWLAPSLVLKVRPSSYGEERRGELHSSTAPTTVSFVLAPTAMPMVNFATGFFLGTFCSDSHWIVSVWIQLGSPAEHSTDEATRKKNVVLCLFCVAESETAVVSTC